MDDDSVNRLVEERIAFRSARNYDAADEIKTRLLNAGIQVIDIPRKEGGGAKWVRVVRDNDVDDKSILSLVKDLWRKHYQCEKALQCDILQHIKTRLDLVINELKHLIAEPKLQRVSMELNSRQFADVAFTLALCGVDDIEVYSLLLQGMTLELQRIGGRKSFHVAELLRIANRFACAGVTDKDFSHFVISLLRKKELSDDLNASLQLLHKGCFSLLSLHTKNMLWKYVSKLHKYGRQISPLDADDIAAEPDTADDRPTYKKARLGNDALNIDFASLFSDCSKPLVLDLGCGFGVSLLCLAHLDDAGVYNYLGCDASIEGISYASSVSKRWNMSHCQFVVSDVLPLLQCVMAHYPGDTSWIIINFPTPYVSTMIPQYHPTITLKSVEEDTSKQFNSQLPTIQNHFMITMDLFDMCAQVLARNKASTGNLLLQSNVEDVAVAIRNMAEQIHPVCGGRFEVPRILVDGIACVDRNNTMLSDEYKLFAQRQLSAFYDSFELENKIQSLRWATLAGRNACSQRQQLWIDSNGPRAEGVGWLAETPFPCGAMSETEAVYKLNDKFVYRVWLNYSRSVT